MLRSSEFEEWCESKGGSVSRIQSTISCKINGKTIENHGKNGLTVREDGELIGGGDFVSFGRNRNSLILEDNRGREHEVDI